MIAANINKTYKIKNCPAVQALKNANFMLADTGMVFFLGKSGSGKSTLLNVLSGLDKADEGSSIEIAGKDICKLSIKELDNYRNSCCGFVFQEYNLIPELNVEENISLAIQLQGIKKTADKVREVLSKVGLDGYEKRKVTELSGGQKQRVAIARALIKEPQIIFADEPTGALDKCNGESVMSLLKELSNEQLVIVVSHDRDYAIQYGDRIIELEDGEIIADSGANASMLDTGEIRSNDWRKSHLPIKTALKIGCSNFKLHPIRLIATLILSILTFSLFGVSLNIALMNPQRSFINAVYEQNLEYTAIYKYNVTENVYTGTFDKVLGSNGLEFNELCLSKLDISLLRGKYDMEFNLICSAYITSFQQHIAATINQLNAYNPTTAKHLSQHSDGFMSMSLEQCGELGFKITGRLPENANEIAINECMLNTFMLAGIKENGSIYPINCASEILGHKICILADSFINGKPMPNNGRFGDSDIKTIVGVVDTGCDKQCSKSHMQSESMLYAENYHEKIFICEGAFNDWSYVLCNINPNKADFKNFAEFVFDYNENNEVFRFSNRLMTPGSIDANSFYSFLNTINIDKNLYLYIGAILLIVSFLFLSNFVATSVRSQMKQIGIITSLGANFKQKCKIYLGSALIIACLVFVLSLILTAIWTVLYNRQLIELGQFSFDMLKFNALLPLLLCVIICACIVIGCLIPMLRMQKLTAVQIINKGQIK